MATRSTVSWRMVMITVIVALMTLPCHCWGKVRLSRQEGANVPLKSHTHTHTHHKLSLSPWSQDPTGGGQVMWELWLRWEKDEPRVHSHVPRGRPRPPEEGSRPAWLS